MAKKDNLSDVYSNMLEERRNRESVLNISSNTGDLIGKSHPKSKLVTRYEEEIFGLDAEDIKKLPIKAVEMLQQALQFLIARAQDDPTVFQALRKLIRNASQMVDEEANPEPEAEEFPEDYRESVETSVLDKYKSFLSSLSEAKITKLNYAAFLQQVQEGEIRNPLFNNLLLTFGFDPKQLKPLEKAGILKFLLELANKASQNNTIAIAFNRIVNIEAKAKPEEVSPLGESLKQELETFVSLNENVIGVSFDQVDWKAFADEVKAKVPDSIIDTIDPVKPDLNALFADFVKFWTAIQPILVKHKKILDYIQRTLKENPEFKKILSAFKMNKPAESTTPAPAEEPAKPAEATPAEPKVDEPAK